MERSWMQSTNRLSKEYIKGIDDFLDFASTNGNEKGAILCPCKKCNNVLHFTKEEVRAHLIMNGIVKSYTKWYFHGESYVPSNSSLDELASEGGHDGMLNLIKDIAEPEFMDSTTDDALEEEIVQSDVEEPPKYDKAPPKYDKATAKFLSLLEDAQQKLYPNCETFTKLSFIVKLFQIKCLFGISDTAITDIMKLVKEALPSGETLPESFYKARKMIKDLGLDYKEIEACKNDCMLFWKADKDRQHCLKCGESRYKCDKSTDEKGVPHKVLRYFPLAPRLQRLFLSSEVASSMRWYNEERIRDGVLRHPADSEVWRSFDKRNPGFALEPRNVRIGLSADGVNPFGNMTTFHSTWPVIVTVYNLPPWMCMKQPYCMMSLLIPGPKAPGNDIDVYLQPLIEDLKELWYYGVDTYDASKKEVFRMRVALLWTINDFPAYANLSGWSTRGALACPSCGKDTHSIRLKHGHKFSYMGARRFLSSNHKWRDDKRSFDGKVERRSPPTSFSGDEVLKQLDSLTFYEFGKSEKRKKNYDTRKYLNWKKKSIFFQLPYWKTILLRHNLDVMHIEKNICDNIIGTLLDIEGKTKDGVNSRRDLQLMKIRKKLHPIEKDGKYYLPLACYNMLPEAKDKFCTFLEDLKVPDGFSSNISNCVRDRKLYGLKSHDSHVILERLLPLALRGVVLPSIYDAITELCIYFRELCSRELSVDVLNHLESSIPITLCKLERLFPPSFFDIMVHLAMHLATEAKLAGPVQFRWMYPIERFLRKLKCYVRNKNHPEGCMAEGYIVEESIIFCSRYLHGVHNPFDKLERNGDRDSIGSGKKVSVFNQNGYPLTMDKNRSLEDLERTQAHIYILNNCEKVQPFIREYETSSKNEDFAEWFKNHASQLCTNKDVQSRAELLSLARGPLYGVERFNGYVINGFRFHTKKHETRKAKQNSGILLKGLMGSKVVDYYGVLTEIIELQYLGGNRVVMFKCEWWDVENIDRGVKVDKYGFVSVNTSRKLVTNEPFVLASQVEQVFYAQDGSNPNWIVVLKGQSQSSFDHFSEDSVDEQSYEQEEAFQQEKSATNYPIHNLVQGNELDDWEENDEAHDDSDDNSNHSENSADEGQSSGESEDNDDFLL